MPEMTLTYYVARKRVGDSLGPHRVFREQSYRVVKLTEKQAKFYVDQGVLSIEPCSER